MIDRKTQIKNLFVERKLQDYAEEVAATLKGEERIFFAMLLLRRLLKITPNIGKANLRELMDEVI